MVEFIIKPETQAAHFGAGFDVFWDQFWLRVFFLEIFANGLAFTQEDAVNLENGHLTCRVAAQVIWRAFPIAFFHQLNFDFFLRQNQTHFAAKGR